MLHKVFIGTRNLTTGRNGLQKFCLACSKAAEVEALFDVGDGVTAIEKYCLECSYKL